jgi:hypothetical protein
MPNYIIQVRDDSLASKPWTNIVGVKEYNNAKVLKLILELDNPYCVYRILDCLGESL